MANFNEAFQLMILHEGGYVNDPDDLGGETYKGVARKIHPNWEGWKMIDLLKKHVNFPQSLELNPGVQQAVINFYRHDFWETINGDNIVSQKIANSIFDFGVNAGTKTSVKLAQKVVGVDDDGVIGNLTTSAINNFDEEKFLPLFTVCKIKRYRDICLNNTTQKKFFFGWVVRTLEERV